MGSGMFRKLLGAIGLAAAVATPALAQPYAPYPKNDAANSIYNLLFCDEPASFRPKDGNSQTAWQEVLYGPVEDVAKVTALANDASAEGRTRVLAYNWLRSRGHATPKGQVLGVILEIPLDGGLDVLAAYQDGGVRYINHTGSMAIVEADGSEAARMAKALVESAAPLVARIGPWDKRRLPPPKPPDVRITFLVSDGLYFGQGPWGALQNDAMAGPLLAQGGRLLSQLVEARDGKAKP